MNDYLKQAKEFCTKNNVTIEVKFLYKGYHFEDDKQKRDIYQVTINRKNGKNLKPFIFNFGSSINDTKSNYDRNGNRKRRGLTVPNEYDILACITKYEIGDFDDFVSTFGYTFETEKECIKIKGIHLAVKEEYENIYRLFSDVMEELQDIQ